MILGDGSWDSSFSAAHGNLNRHSDRLGSFCGTGTRITKT
jgi:hypothetical protein